jgi:hypothetical protein
VIALFVEASQDALGSPLAGVWLLWLAAPGGAYPDARSLGRCGVKRCVRGDR